MNSNITMMYTPYLVKKDINKSSYIKNFDIILVLNNIQYPKHLAEIFQLAKAFRISKIFITGDSQKPPFGNDLQKASQKSEKSIEWEISDNIFDCLNRLKKSNYVLMGIDTSEKSTSVFEFKTDSDKIALVLGNESTGLAKPIKALLDKKVFIPNNLESGSLSLNLAASSILTSIVINKK